MGGRGEGGRGSGDGSQGWVQLALGFVNCRGWWSREVDVKLTLQLEALAAPRPLIE